MSNEFDRIAGDLQAMEIMKKRRELETTVLRRDGGFSRAEVSVLVTELFTEASQHPKQTDYVILFGHYKAERIIALVGEAVVKNVTGLAELPWNPGWTI